MRCLLYIRILCMMPECPRANAYVYCARAIANIYCILCGQIKRFNSFITVILFEVGSYRTVVGYSYRMLE